MECKHPEKDYLCLGCGCYTCFLADLMVTLSQAGVVNSLGGNFLRLHISNQLSLSDYTPHCFGASFAVTYNASHIREQLEQVHIWMWLTRGSAAPHGVQRLCKSQSVEVL